MGTPADSRGCRWPFPDQRSSADQVGAEFAVQQVRQRFPVIAGGGSVGHRYASASATGPTVVASDRENHGMGGAATIAAHVGGVNGDGATSVRRSPAQLAGAGSYQVLNTSVRDEDTLNTGNGRRTADELRVLGIPPDRAGAYRWGRDAGVQAERRYGGVPDHVVDVIAGMVVVDDTVVVEGTVRSAG